MLYWSQLPYDDDSAFFWVFAEIYDAHPYKPMNEENRAAYEFLKKIYEEQGKVGLGKVVQSTRNPHTIQKETFRCLCELVCVSEKPGFMDYIREIKGEAKTEADRQICNVWEEVKKLAVLIK